MNQKTWGAEYFQKVGDGVARIPQTRPHRNYNNRGQLWGLSMMKELERHAFAFIVTKETQN